MNKNKIKKYLESWFYLLENCNSCNHAYDKKNNINFLCKNCFLTLFPKLKKIEIEKFFIITLIDTDIFIDGIKILK